MDAAAVLALIIDLYSQVAKLQQENAELRAALAEQKQGQTERDGEA